MDSYIHLYTYVSVLAVQVKDGVWRKINLKDLIYKDIVFSKFSVCAKVTSHLNQLSNRGAIKVFL